jgi:hypothetical protein
MSELISVPVSSKVFARLQALSVPLVDDASTVIERLLNHWEANPPNRGPVQAKPKVTSELWRSARGDVLPVGTPLQATYLSKTLRALVERNGIRFNGKLYGNLTAAGVAAKGHLGRKGRTASTNGRNFWKFQDPATEQWIPVAALRPSHRIDGDALLAELDRMQ